MEAFRSEPESRFDHLRSHIYGSFASVEERHNMAVALDQSRSKCESLLEMWDQSRYAEHTRGGPVYKAVLGLFTWPW